MLYDKWLKLKNEILRLLHDLAQSREQSVAQKARHEQSKLVEELAAVKGVNSSLVHEVSKLREVSTSE